MSSYIEVLPDGTVEITRRMSDYVKSLPTLMQWTLWCALTRPDRPTVIASEEKDYELIGGRLLERPKMALTLFTCIGCGELFDGYPNAWKSKMRDNESYKITIGAIVRKQEESQTIDAKGRTTREKGFVPIPVRKRGLGCPTCLALFHEEEKKAARQHEAATRVDTLNAQIALLSGCAKCNQQRGNCICGVDAKGRTKFKPHTFTAMTKATPMIMMFRNGMSCGDCKDTFHRWEPSIGKHVICSCYKAKQAE